MPQIPNGVQMVTTMRVMSEMRPRVLRFGAGGDAAEAVKASGGSGGGWSGSEAFMLGYRRKFGGVKRREE